MVCNTLGIHEKKFIEICEKSAITLIMNLSDVESKRNLVREKYDLMVIVNLSNLEDDLVNINANKKIGISLAFEINEKHDFDRIRKNISRLDHIIVDCDHVKNSLYEEYGYLGPITKIAYGCNFTEIHNKTKIKNSYNNQGILSVRSWNEIHQNMIVIELSDQIRGENRYITMLKPPKYSKIKEKRNSTLRFLSKEYYDMNSLFNLLSNHAFYLSTSKSDGTSITLLESMSAARVCIVSSFPSNLEWITHGKNGLVYKDKSFESLKDVVNLAFSLSIDDRIKMGNLAMEKAREYGNWELHEIRLASIISEALN